MSCDMCKFRDGKCVAMRRGGRHCCTPHCKYSTRGGCTHPGGKPMMCELWFCQDAIGGLPKASAKMVATRYILAQLSLPDVVDGRPKYPYWHKSGRQIDDIHLVEAHLYMRSRGKYPQLRGVLAKFIRKWIKM